LAKLALVTGADVPFDVLVDGRPPEAVEECAARGVEPPVSEVVVGVVNDAGSLIREDEELVSSVTLSSPESTVKQKEAC
jgi:hypothetical protein